MLNLDIITDNSTTIHASFDRIATDMIHNWNLQVNQNVYSFTEIEFYFYLDEIHMDHASHKHNYDGGKWRFHLQGLDIALQAKGDKKGGILIRGLKNGNSYINGPKRVLAEIFKSFGDVHVGSKSFGLSLKSESSREPIFKTARHGLSDMQNNLFKDSFYRYYIEVDKWDKKHTALAEQARIQNNSLKL